MESKCRTLYCTHCWLKIEVIRKSLSSRLETCRGKCTSPVVTFPPALNADMHIFSLTMMAWNYVLFQVWHEWGCCLVWQAGALLSQASVGGAVLAVATVEGCFLLLPCTVSSVTGQCEVFSRGPVSLGSIVATARAACLSSSPLIDQHACFSFPWSGKANWGTFDSPCFPGPRAHSWGRSALQVLWGNVGQERWAFSLVGVVYEGGWAVCQHSKSCCQGNDVYNCPSVCSCQQKQSCQQIFP